uniref:UBN2 domain-containing protein n=1 Tax=Phaseolus vulgaris TaxID=3885 RepID=V7B620_PHAVU|nr:hypothetical protein PHAVU_008G179100g [Phaseolus vulgaris]ESW13234.1 hypothetical protein PHAVU_008G179100g [Phaseolus vulgaris]
MMRTQYETFKIEEGESIQFMIAHLQFILNKIRTLGIVMSQYDVNDKILKTLPLKWRSQVNAFRTSNDLEAMPLEEMVGNPIVYERVLQGDDNEVKRKTKNLKTFHKKKKI